MMMDCKRRFNKAFFLLITGIFIMLPIMGKAQDLPCDGTDPYTTCPLDSWVTVVIKVKLLQNTVNHFWQFFQCSFGVV
jgi:hypothetical protein